MILKGNFLHHTRVDLLHKYTEVTFNKNCKNTFNVLVHFFTHFLFLCVYGTSFPYDSV